VPDLRSEMTDGRMQMGGTRMRVRIRSLGRPVSGFIISSGMSWNTITSTLYLNHFSTKELILLSVPSARKCQATHCAFAADIKTQICLFIVKK